MRVISLTGRVTYARFTVEVCLASAAAAAAFVADVRALATLDDAGLVRSSHMVRRLRSSADDVTATQEGTTCLVPLTTMILGLLLRSSEELEPPAP